MKKATALLLTAGGLAAGMAAACAISASHRGPSFSDLTVPQSHVAAPSSSCLTATPACRIEVDDFVAALAQPPAVRSADAAGSQASSSLDDPPTLPSPSELTDEDKALLAQLPRSCLVGLYDAWPEMSTSLRPDEDAAACAATSEQAAASSEEPISPVRPAAHFDSLAGDSSVSVVERLPPADLAGAAPHSVSPAAPHSSWASSATPMAAAQQTAGDSSAAIDPHAEVFAESLFPSALTCAKCHEQIYKEWASSSHAYAAVSPMFHRFEDTVQRLTHGTIGYFCMRCHAPVATTMEMCREQSIYDGPRVWREGITCVACHRVKYAYTKVNGERRIEPGDIYDPVWGGGDGQGVATALAYAEHFKLKTHADDPAAGQPIHRAAIQFEPITSSDFCMSCHQVAVPPGIKLEVVWDQYRSSPAYRQGTTCQDCHMGRVPGVAAGYSCGPAAVMDGKVVNASRRHSNHMFYGPGYSIAHPGVFPDNAQADRWSVRDWLQFDWRAGWGTDAFEEAIAASNGPVSFPPAWAEADDRYDARQVIDANLQALAYKRDVRRQVMENGSRLDGPFFSVDPRAGQPLRFHYVVANLNPGHNLPTASLGAQPQLWLNVALIGPDGRRIWESGYLDANGDLADRHSDDVLHGRIPLDRQLFNLQTKFLITNVKGTDREMYLPVNVDVDPLPFIRPAPQPVAVLNHPPGVRMEAHSLPPLGDRAARFTVPAECLSTPGVYRLTARLRSRTEPMYFMRFVGATPEMIRSMIEGTLDVHPRSVVFEVK
jgi:hypothetical protein